MSTITKRTNGDLIQPFVDEIKRRATAMAKWAQEHPDEAVLAITPLVLITAATRRHHLTYAEAAVTAEVGYWCGVLAVKTYRDWKSKPAGPVLKRVS